MSRRYNTAEKFPVDEVLHFWLQHTPPDKRFARDEQLDQEIQNRFGSVTYVAQQGGYDHGDMSTRGKLALIIVLDQFSRNIYRGTAQSFAGDAKALELTKELLREGADEGLTIDERAFLYMPLEHSENLQDQELSVRLYHAMGKGKYANYARRHKEIIERFGRFPHRNAILGRASTTAEKEFLQQSGSSF